MKTNDELIKCLTRRFTKKLYPLSKILNIEIKRLGFNFGTKQRNNFIKKNIDLTKKSSGFLRLPPLVQVFVECKTVIPCSILRCIVH